jgi:hypothetical protein
MLTMRTRIIVMALLVAGALASCRNEKKEALTALDIAKGRIQTSIDSLNGVLVTAAESLSGMAADPEAIRVRLKKVMAESPLTQEVSFITAGGSRQVVEPKAYRSSEGTSLGVDSPEGGAMQQKQPAFSGFCMSPQGFQAVRDVHPVMNGSTLIGAIESSFAPYEMIHRIRIKLVTAPSELWVMDQDGTVIYQQDPSTVGKNVLKDEAFSKFDNFQTACKTIAGAESGEVTYTYYSPGTTNPVEKLAYWKTVKMHDKSWKIIHTLDI